MWFQKGKYVHKSGSFLNSLQPVKTMKYRLYGLVENCHSIIMWAMPKDSTNFFWHT